MSTMRGHNTGQGWICPPLCKKVLLSLSRAVEVATNFVYTTEYLKLRVGKQSTALEFRALNGKIVYRHADMLTSATGDGWNEVESEQLIAYRTQFPAISCWLKLIGRR